MALPDISSIIADYRSKGQLASAGLPSTPTSGMPASPTQASYTDTTQPTNPAGTTPGGGTGPLIIDPNQTDPHAIAAQLLKAQFSEWESTFEPIELQAMQELSFINPSVLTNAVNEAGGAAKNTYGAMSGVLNRENRALGVAPTAQQSQASNRILNLSQAQAQAGAENVARENVRTQDEQILLGAAPNYNIVKGTIQ
jgi:hypothetical protein